MDETQHQHSALFKFIMIIQQRISKFVDLSLARHASHGHAASTVGRL
jgi:hypothetical protein